MVRLSSGPIVVPSLLNAVVDYCQALLSLTSSSRARLTPHCSGERVSPRPEQSRIVPVLHICGAGYTCERNPASSQVSTPRSRWRRSRTFSITMFPPWWTLVFPISTNLLLSSYLIFGMFLPARTFPYPRFRAMNSILFLRIYTR